MRLWQHRLPYLAVRDPFFRSPPDQAQLSQTVTKKNDRDGRHGQVDPKDDSPLRQVTVRSGTLAITCRAEAIPSVSSSEPAIASRGESDQAASYLTVPIWLISRLRP